MSKKNPCTVSKKVHMQPELAQDIEAYCNAMDIAQSQFMRQLLREGLNYRNQKADRRTPGRQMAGAA